MPPQRERGKDANLAQKLGQLQPFIAVFPSMNAWANLHRLSQPDTFLTHRPTALALREHRCPS